MQAITKLNANDPVIWSDMNNKFGEIEARDAELDNKINVLKEAKLITSLNEITESIKYKGAMIANAPIQDFIIIDATVFDSTWKVATAYTLNLNLIWKGAYKNSVWTWEPIATTTKTSFSLTPNTGYTINTQNCYVQDDKAFFRARITKTDGTAFGVGNHITVATLPTSYSLQPISYVGEADGFYKSIGVGVVSGTAIVVSTITENTKSVLISGVLI